MSIEVVAAVRDKYPTPLGARHREFLFEVAGALGMGLVRKTTGTFIACPPPIDGVSQDVVMTTDGRAWDILIDGENEARAAFNPIDPIEATRFVSVAPPGAAAAAASAPAGTEPLAAELARIRVLVERLCGHLGVPIT